LYGGLKTRLGVGDAECWANYKLLQVYDRLSLYFCLKDVESGEPDALGPAPRDDEEDAVLQLEPAGPWRVRMSPFPFASSPARFTLVRRVLPKRGWQGNDDFRSDFFATAPETVEVAIEQS
jgi:hypothetical protein